MSHDCANNEFTLDDAETPWLVGYKDFLEDEQTQYVSCLALSEEDACRQVEDLYPKTFVIEAQPTDYATLNACRSQQRAA